jgi:hypothetical protein
MIYLPYIFNKTAPDNGASAISSSVVNTNSLSSDTSYSLKITIYQRQTALTLKSRQVVKQFNFPLDITSKIILEL